MGEVQFAASSYSFQALLDSGRLSQFSCIAEARALGFDAIEFVGVMPHDGSSRENYAARLREEAARQGLAISNYCTGAELMTGGPAKIAEEVRRVKLEVDIAALLGSPRMRHDATSGYQPQSPDYCSFQAAIPRLAPPIREIAEYAAGKGVLTMVENHGFYCQDSDRIEALYTAVAHPNFRLLADMGNFLCADEDPLLAFTRVAPYAAYVHAKDFHVKTADQPNPGEGFFRSRSGQFLRGAIIGHGNVPVRPCLAVLKKQGYSGTISLEFEGMESNLQALAIGLHNLRAYWESLD